MLLNKYKHNETALIFTTLVPMSLDLGLFMSYLHDLFFIFIFIFIMINLIISWLHNLFSFQNIMKSVYKEKCLVSCGYEIVTVCEILYFFY